MGLLRLLLAIAVFNAHAWNVGVTLGPFWLNPFVAVCSFYLISGFYMSMVIDQTYSRIDNGTRRFYLNRFVRLYPTYFIVLLGSIMLQLSGQFSTPIEYLWSGSETYTSSNPARILPGFVNDLLLFPAPLLVAIFDTNLRPPLTAEMLILPAYTVGVEVLFYLLAPFIVRIGWKPLAALLIFAAALQLAPAAMSLPWRPFQYDFFPGVLVFFMTGVVSYRLSQGPLRGLFEYLPGGRNRVWTLASTLAAYAIIGMLALGAWRYVAGVQGNTNSLRAWAFYLCIAAVTPVAFALTKRSRFDRFLGDLTYPLYLVHFPLLLWAAHQQLASGRMQDLLVVGTVGTATLALTFLVERPLQEVRSRNRADRASVAAP